jgi:hypothetical protein
MLCDVCKKDVPKSKIERGSAVLNELPLEVFEDIIACFEFEPGAWASASICIDCVEYYA